MSNSDPENKWIYLWLEVSHFFLVQETDTVEQNVYTPLYENI